MTAEKERKEDRKKQVKGACNRHEESIIIL